MSKEANAIIRWMVQELSTCKYGHRAIVVGCYQAAVLNYKLDTPKEGETFIVDTVLNILNSY